MINIIPYVETKKGWSIPDDHMIWIFTKMLKQGLVKKTFPAGLILTNHDWMELVKNKAHIVHIITNEKTVVAVTWLSNIGHNHAFCHFCVFREGWGKSKHMARELLKKLFSYKGHGGEPLFDVICGRTPANNRLALKMLERVGFTIIGKIPDICLDVYDCGKVDAVFSYIKREATHGW